MATTAAKQDTFVWEGKDKRGQKVKAFVVLADFAEPSDELADKIKSFVKDQIAPYKYPREVEFVDALPKTATGKLRRSELRQSHSNSTMT